MKRIAELLLPTNIICATITVCSYFLLDGLTTLEPQSSILRSLIFLEILFILMSIICIVVVLKESKSRK